jgi:hypothetical protein
MAKEHKVIKSNKYFGKPRPEASNVKHPLDSLDDFFLLLWSAWDDFIELANGKYGERDDVWVTLKPIEESLRGTWDTTFKWYWIERYIDEMGYMLWNRVYNVEKKSEAADKALAKFEACWK